MSLPQGFQLSQGSLQDFADCRRRFQLRYLLHLAWPAVPSEPVLELERYLQQGARFHRMVQQHLVGVPLERLVPMLDEEDLSRWWDNYVRFSLGGGLEALAGSDSRRYPEISLSAPLGTGRLLAKMDLVAVSPQGRVLILDWKTARKRPPRQWLADRLQTRVYPFLLVEAGAFLNGGKPFEPEQVEMVYWFADFPDQPERFPYNAAAFQADRDYLAETVAEIQRLGENDFPLTGDVQRCVTCVYRSLCERGEKAGAIDESATAEEVELALDFEQIAEIEY